MMRIILIGGALVAIGAFLWFFQTDTDSTGNSASSPSLSRQTDDQSTHQELGEQFMLAKKQSRNGQHPQALQHFLALWDLDPKQAGPIRGIRTSLLLSEIARIAEVYPPGLGAIQQRVEILKRKWATTQDRDTLSDLFALGATFRDEVDTLGLFDSIDAESSLKTEFSHYAFDYLLAAERYQDIVKFNRPLVQLERTLAVSKRRDAQNRTDPRSLQMKAQATEFLRSKVTKELHALIAANEAEEARKYAEMYSKYDSSDEAKAAIAAGAAAAGSPHFFED